MAANALTNERARETLAQILSLPEFSQVRMARRWGENVRRMFTVKTNIHDWTIGDVGHLLFLALIILAGIFLIFYLWRKVVPFWKTMVQDVAVEDEQVPASQRPTPDVFLREAEQKALLGDFRGALRDVYLCSLMEMDNHRLISYNSAKTNSEYLGEVDKKAADLMAPFQSLVNLYECKWYGLEACGRDDFQKGRELSMVLRGDRHSWQKEN